MGLASALPSQSPSILPYEAGSETGFSDRVLRLLDRIDYRIANSSKERNAIFRLRYEAYMREESIAPNSARLFADPYDETDNVYIFGLYLDDQLASSIRIHVASREHPDFPSLGVFRDLMQPELDAGKIIIDPTRFVTDEKLSRLHRGLPHLTLRLCWLAAAHFNADHFLVAIRAEHQAFYRRTFGHELICEPRPYPRLKKPISLMTVHYPTVAEQVHRRYPFFRSTYFERRMLFERPVSTPAALQPAAGATAREWPTLVEVDLGSAARR
jgi:hypothetical protein